MRPVRLLHGRRNGFCILIQTGHYLRRLKTSRMRRIIMMMVAAVISISAAEAQSSLKKVYDETIDPMQQVDKAIGKADAEGKHVICQVGGNWCRWCLMFADFMEKDSEISSFVDRNYVFIHVNYNPRERNDKAKMAKTEKLLKRLGNPGRFGYPVFVVLDADGKVLHIQDSSFLEEGNGYNKEKVMRFFKNWTPECIL